MKQSKRKKACLKIWLTPRGLFHQVLENDSHVSALRWLEKILDAVDGADNGLVTSKPADSFGCVFLKLSNGKRGLLDFTVAKHASSKQADQTARLFVNLRDAFMPAAEQDELQGDEQGLPCQLSAELSAEDVSALSASIESTPAYAADLSAATRWADSV